MIVGYFVDFVNETYILQCFSNLLDCWTYISYFTFNYRYYLIITTSCTFLSSCEVVTPCPSTFAFYHDVAYLESAQI